MADDPICANCGSPVGYAINLHDHDKRVTELLQANNELLERARTAEADALRMRDIARMAVVVAGEMSKELLRKP